MQFAWFASIRNDKTRWPEQAHGTTEASNKEQAKAQVRAKLRQLPGRKTVTRIDIY